MARKMTQRAAFAEAVKRWGKNAGIRDEPKLASTPAQRAEYSRLYQANRELLKATTDVEEKRRLRAIERDLAGRPHHHRYTIGHIAMGGLFFMVEGQGDTWEECFAAHDRRKEADAKRYDELKAGRG